MTDAFQTSLPNEIYRFVVQNLEDDMATLLAVLLASRTLQLEAERPIYQCMVQRNEVNHRKFLTSILGCSRRALLVERYSQEGVSHDGKYRLWSLLCRGLDSMQNLKHFTVRTMLITGSPTEFHGQYGFRLTTLDLRGPCSGNQLIVTFLQLQTKLASLSIEWHEIDKEFILPSTCPHLRFLRGNRGAIEAFLPGRSILSLAWAPHPTDSFMCAGHLSSALSNIRALSYGGFFQRPDLDLIIRHLRDVEILRIVEPSLNELITLSQIPNLQILILLCQYSRRVYDFPPFSNPTDQVIRDLIISCHSLRHIDISAKRSNYNRWTHKHTGPHATAIAYQTVHSWWDIGGVQEL